MGGESLDLPTDLFGFDANRDTIIDSGTTLAYLPSRLYNQVIEKVHLLLQSRSFISS